MDLKSLVAEFQNYRHSDRAKLENVELCYSLWAAHCTSSVHEHHAETHASKTAGVVSAGISAVRKEISNAIAAASNHIDVKKAALHSGHEHLDSRVAALESDNKHIKSELKDLKDLVLKLQATISKLSLGGAATNATQVKAQAAPASTTATKKEADDEIDLFGSDDEEDEEKAKVTEQRLKAYAEKKSKKPGVIAKSSVILDVKPWDDETDMGEMEKTVRSIEMDGLLWGASKLVPVGYGIKKLQIMCVVEDDKVSIEELQEKIEAFEDFVQSVDIAAFNKI